MTVSCKSWIAGVLAVSTVMTSVLPAGAETLNGALARAYANSQSLNASRAQLRATDENVTQARAGLRPRIQATGQAQASRSRTDSNVTRNEYNSNGALAGAIQINQTIFDGFQTPNNIEAARAQVRASQYNLQNTEQNTLSDTVTAYMNVLRDRQIAALRRQNLAFLQEQVRAAGARFDVGEGTRTDVAQAQAEQALATALLNSALAQVASSEASYFDIVGDAPGNLEPGRVPNAVLPKSIDAAFGISQREHPAILAGLAAVDAASFQVKSAEGQLLPTIGLTGSVDNTFSGTRSTGGEGSLPGVNLGQSSALSGVTIRQNETTATIGAQITIPIYQGGLPSSQIRQNKEVLGQRRIEVDGYRDQVRAAVASAWAQYEAAQANVTGYQAQAQAAQLALNGVVEERNVGQRTTLDVLNAQADLISARILLVGSQRDVVVAGYALISAVGRLSAERLGLAGKKYDPKDHYRQVEDKWFGLRTPDGR